nr:unnamed protein product [Callosobruchus chinensis]
MSSTVPGPSSSYQPVNKISLHNRKTHGKCTRCGKFGHLSFSQSCPAKGSKCNKCGLKGHFALLCKTSSEKHGSKPTFASNKRRRVNFVSTQDDSDIENTDDKIQNFECFRIEECDLHLQNTTRDDMVKCNVGGANITFLIDSGSKANIICGADWEQLLNRKAVIWNVNDQVGDVLKPYATGSSIEVKNKFEATVNLPGAPEVIVPFYVVEKGEISLLGKHTAIQLGVLKLGLDVLGINTVTTFPKIKNIIVKLAIDHSVKPVQQPVRRVPISVEKKVEEKLEEALKTGIIERVTEPSPWISPMVIIFKPNGDIRICIDMRRANEAILRENYPLPTFDSFMTKLRNAQYFSRLDLTNAYHQLELDTESRGITTFITHKGMFRYTRLMFGVNSAPEIFQRVFEGLLASCENCLNYLDDIIVFGRSVEEHDRCLKSVLSIFQDNNVLLNREKCIMKVRRLEFLGHNLSSEGIDANDKKIKTILDFRPPATKEELRSFLGLVTYVGKFIPDLGTLTDPLRQLTKKETKFTWNDIHQLKFTLLKNALSKPPTLGYFDPERRTRLIADASPVALGAVLLQFTSETPKVISFASKSLSDVERRYSQTEKESLALVWAVERFYFYLAGLEFELVTDHKPLEAIFKPTSRPPARIERWVLRLQAFKFKVIYQSGKLNIADSVSRLCLLQNEPSFDREEEQHIYTIVEQHTPKAMRISQIIQESKADTQITEAVAKINSNSWEASDKNIYFPFRLELSTFGPVILRGNRIVIPESLRNHTLELSHEGHPGETVMKRRLRAKVWWPLIDRQVENFVKQCRDCLLVSQPNRQPPMTRHKFPEGPWQCLAVDLLGPLPNQESVFVVIDYYSRYQDIKFLRTTTATKIINYLNELFARFGIPKSIRSDNGRQFVSEEFKKFCNENNISLIHTPPYWPQANGLVENMNKSLVKRLQIAHSNKLDYKSELQKFILMYNVTPQGTTGKSPSELLFKRNIRDKIPSISDLMTETADEEALDNDILNKQKGKEREDKNRRAKEHNIKPGDKVFIENMVIPHKLTTRYDKNQYEVIHIQDNEATLMRDGKIFKRHVSHLKKVPDTSKRQIITSPSPHNALAMPSALTDARELENLEEEERPEPLPEQPAVNVEKEKEAVIEENHPTPAASGSLKPLRLKKKDGVWQTSET